MRLAILTDVHGDIHALDDALAVIDRMGCETILCAGDVIDFGLFPDETIARLAERQIPTILGNHERWAIETRHGSADLDPASKRWLRGLPGEWRATLEGVRVAMHHASPKGDMAGIYPGECRHRRGRVPLSPVSPVPMDPPAGAEAVPRKVLPHAEAHVGVALGIVALRSGEVLSAEGSDGGQGRAVR